MLLHIVSFFYMVSLAQPELGIWYFLAMHGTFKV